MKARATWGVVFAGFLVWGVIAALGPTSADAATPVVKSALGAGYRSEPGNGIASGSTTFVLPAITCASASDVETLLLGVSAYVSNSLTASAIATAKCDHSVKSYTLTASTTSQNNSVAAAAGDKIVTSLSESSTTTRATVRNATQHTGATATMGPASISNVLIGARGVPTVPTFTSVTMKVCQVNGLSLGQATPLTRELLRTNGTVQIGAAALADADSDSFKLTFKSNH